MLSKAKNIILDILFPAICLNCKNKLSEKEKGAKICRKCLDSIEIHSSFFCPKCKNRCPDLGRQCHTEIKFILAAATSYQNQSVKNLIWFFKYKKWKSIAKTIEPIIQNYLEILNENFKDYTIIPIPLHKDRFKERGFNQSHLLAEIIAEKLHTHIESNILKRIKSTKNQAELKNVREREENIKNCFNLENPEKIKNRNIILVDDVFTTGSTMTEAVKTLKQGGAKKIIAFVFAKA